MKDAEVVGTRGELAGFYTTIVCSLQSAFAVRPLAVCKALQAAAPHLLLPPSRASTPIAKLTSISTHCMPLFTRSSTGATRLSHGLPEPEQPPTTTTEPSAHEAPYLSTPAKLPHFFHWKPYSRPARPLLLSRGLSPDSLAPPSGVEGVGDSEAW